MADTDELTMESKSDNPYGRAGGAVPSTAKVVGDKEAEASGLYESTSGVKELLSLVPQKTEKLNQDLLTAKTKQAGANETANREFENLTGADRDKMEKAYTAAAAGPSSLPPAWDADKQRADRIRGPMEQFGSIGSIFAMAASMFTRTPMTSALNAGAAAMEAIRAGDEKGYESAYTAWKDNTELARKRFDMERALFTDANTLLTTDTNLWKAKTLANAARFDDQKTIAFLNAGMYPEVLQTQSALIKGYEEWVKAEETFDKFDLRHRLLKDKTPQEQIELIQRWDKGPPPIEEALLDRKRQEYRAQHGTEMPADLQSKFLSDFKHNSRGSGITGKVGELAEQIEAKKLAEGMDPIQAKIEALQEAQKAGAKPGNPNTKEAAINRRADDLMKKAEAEGKPISRMEAEDMAGKQITAARQADKKAAATISAEIDRRAKEYEAKGMPPSDAYDKAAHEVRKANTAISGNKMVDLHVRHDKFEHSNKTIDKTLNVLQKYSGAAGLAGKVMRVEEMLENIAARGKISQTDRKQMQRDIELLMGWAKPLLFDKAGKGLKTEYDSLRTIIPGLGAGDTTANTIRGFRDLKKLFGDMQHETLAEIEGTWSPETSKSSAGAALEKAKPRWQDAPVTSKP